MCIQETLPSHEATGEFVNSEVTHIMLVGHVTIVCSYTSYMEHTLVVAKKKKTHLQVPTPSRYVRHNSVTSVTLANTMTWLSTDIATINLDLTTSKEP